jgi:peptidyl-prolyl cis-trans isomerase C
MPLLARTFFLFLPFVLMACEVSRPSLAKKVILDVNGKQMSAETFSQELAYRLRDQDALSAKDPKMVQLMKQKIVEEFVVKALTEDWAKENGVLVKAEDLKTQISAIQNSYPDDLAFQQALAEQGTSFKVWKDRLQSTMLQKLVTNRVVEKATPPTDAELQNYYSQHRSDFTVRETAQLRQIVVSTESDAKTIEDQLKKGKRISDLAKKFSISPEAAQGGDVGWVEKGLTEVFESAFRMKQGQRSPIFKTPYGYHIFEVMGRKPARVKAFAEVKEQIKRILMEKREQSLYLAWLEEQVRKARVFKDQSFIDALKVETKAQ